MSPVHPNDSIALGQVGKWRRLRDITNALPEQEFVEAIAHAERRRAKESLLLRAALAYGFPAHPSWAESDAAEALSKRETKAFNLAALSLTSPTLLLEGLELNGRFLTDGRALTLLLRFGPPSFYLDFELDELDAIARSEVYRDLLKCGLRKEP